jgi:hypothetical protein
MLRRLGIGLLWALCGYLAGAVAGGLLVSAVSSNRFDREMEMVMTGIFATGPLVAAIGFIVGATWGSRKRDGRLQN